MNRSITLALALMLVFSWGAQAAQKRKPKTTNESNITNSPPPRKALTKYDKTFSSEAGCITKPGAFMTLHKVGNKVYAEVARAGFGRELLLAATVSGTSDNDVATIGYKASEPLYGRFTCRDSTVFLEQINARPDLEQAEEAQIRAIQLNNINPIVGAYPIFCSSNDKEKVVFEVTSLFRSSELSPLGRRTVRGLSLKQTLDATKSTTDDILAFADNVSVKSTLSYKVTTSLLGLLTILKDAPVTIQVTHTILLLPEKKMRPRVADIRLGTFLTNRTSLTPEADKMLTYSVVNRWRLEAQDTMAVRRGELSEPVKPIVFYLDSAFPEMWRRAAREGILRWNKAFEAIGFKNAIRVEDYPLDDPEFDPDNLKYSCVRYVPTPFSNAMGPSWVDPSTGEIINASVIVYSDVVKTINNWRFCQTAQVDERVRAKRLPDEVMFESLAYVLSHEVGHCLGFMHNMAASAAFPTDSLRSAAFTAKHGTTPSIMDYARFNYVAQPSDKGVTLTPPEQGPYDYHLIKYAYQPIFDAATMEQERSVLSGWIKAREGDPIYRYGRQQVSLRCDPTALEEDLGDDPIKASEYGVANLKYILSHLGEWIDAEQDPDQQHKQELYGAILKQNERYLQAVMMNIGGIRLDNVDGKPRFEAISSNYQRRATKWILSQIDRCGWVDEAAPAQLLSLHVDNAPLLALKTLSDLLSKTKAVVLSSHIATDKGYTPEQFTQDIYDFVWRSTLSSKPLSDMERMMQRKFVEGSISAFAKSSSSSSKSGFTTLDTYRPSVGQMALVGLDEFGLSDKYIAQIQEIEQTHGKDALSDVMFGKAGYNWQSRVNIRAIDETATLWHSLALRCEKLLSSRVASASGATQAHYRKLLQQLRGALSEN